VSRFDDRLADYVDVKERLRQFYDRHPEGRVVTTKVRLTTKPDGVPRVVVEAAAYRNDDDAGVRGWSWMVLPGSTPYTRGSELENVETSAWGRAIGALGIGIDKSVASRDEIDAKSVPPEPEPIVDGLIGTVEIGKPPVDMSVRQTPEGDIYGFRLGNGRKKYQVVATGPLAQTLGVAGLEAGVRAQVWGEVVMVPWDKDGKKMPPYARVMLSRIQTPEFTLPADDQPEAESVALFDEADLEGVSA
jgi:hypothetical protein